MVTGERSVPLRDDLLAALEQWPAEQIAFVDAEGEVSYGQALDCVYRTARALTAKGLSGGQVIACVVPISTKAMLLQLAINQAGCGHLMLPPDIPVDVQAELVGEAQATAVVVDPAAGGDDLLRKLIGTRPLQLFTFGSGGNHKDICSLAEPESPLPFESPARPDALSSLVITGGTTGRPKIVVRRFDSATPRRLGQSALPSEQEPVRLLKFTNISPGLPRFAESALRSGGSVISQKDFDAASVIAGIETHRVTHLRVPPHQLRAIVDHPLLASTDTSSLRWLLCTSARASAQLLRRAIERLGPVVYHGYGMTEATGISRLSPEDYSPGRLDLLATCGKALPGVEIVICNSGGNALAAGEQGYIWVRTPYMMTGYLNRPDLTDKALQDGWLRTGDVGYLDDNNFLTVLGRAADALITTEHRIFLSEVENCVEEYPGVLDCAAFTLPGVNHTQTLHVAVVSETSTQIDEVKLREMMRHRLGPAGVPQSVLRIPEIPRNYSGLPQRPLLAQFAGH